MGLTEQFVRPIFGGHEKFVFRHGWLKKGVDNIRINPHIFNSDEALVSLGVGKNMVRSIRYWCLVTGMVEEKIGVGRIHPLQVSQFAEKLLVDQGWDPYLEDIGSLWLIHWNLCTNLSRAFVWHLLFSKFLEIEFTKRQLSSFLNSQFKYYELRSTMGMIDREVDTCLRTYIPTLRSKFGSIADETLDCPLAELDLIRFIPNDNLYRFNIGPKVSLPLGVFGYALLTFISQLVENRHTVAVDECLYKEGSPGQIFKLDENSVVEYIEKLEELTKGKIRLEETAGLRQIYLGDSTNMKFQDQALELLKGYFEQD